MTETTPNSGPLAGIRVLELGQFIAGPFAASMLGYFGAEVIKIEPPGKGDPLRQWRVVRDGTSLWWHSLARNKKSVAIDLRDPQGQQLVRDLAAGCDVLVENFRPGVMEKRGLGPEQLAAINPGLVYVRVSGYGQDGPLAGKPGFASVCEGFSGFRYVNGFPGEAPVRPNLSIGDTIAGMHAVIGALMGLIHRHRVPAATGQVVDVALYEAMFNLMEAVVPEYSGAGIVREPSGTTVTGIVPTNTYRCADGKYVIIGGNSDPIFVRLMQAIGRDDLAGDQRLAHNPGRVEHESEIDTAIGDWCAAHESPEVIDTLEAADVPVGPILSVADQLEDEHYRARNLFERHDIGGSELEIPAYAPRMTGTPGATRWTGPKLGQHTRDVLGDLLGAEDVKLRDLAERNVIQMTEDGSEL